MDKGNRSRAKGRLDRLAAQGTTPGTAAPSPIDLAQERALEALEPMRLAAALSIVADPERAAALAGIDIDDPAELTDLAEVARRDYGDLIARRSSALGGRQVAARPTRAP